MSRPADDLIRLAHVGMHPDRLRKLVAGSGSAGTVLRRIERGRLDLPEEARRAALVPASERRGSLCEAGIDFVVPGDVGFPERLADLPEAPLFLFQRGRSFRGVAVAIVGTRACTGYGRRLAEGYGEVVSKAGWSVVSGLAKGIDGAAHKGSLRGYAGGVAVLGSGIDVWYPRQHRSLGEDLLEAGGTVWSEAPPGARPLGWRFPPRNRIISGIAHAVVVVEAGVKGGALVTARIALEQGRDIFATPGDVGRPASIGCNLLIRDGAFPVFDAEDLLECLRLLLGEPTTASGEDSPGALNPDPGEPIDKFLAKLGDDPVAAIAELGRLVAIGSVEIDGDGFVITRK